MVQGWQGLPIPGVERDCCIRRALHRVDLGDSRARNDARVRDICLARLAHRRNVSVRQNIKVLLLASDGAGGFSRVRIVGHEAIYSEVEKLEASPGRDQTIRVCLAGDVDVAVDPAHAELVRARQDGIRYVSERDRQVCADDGGPVLPRVFDAVDVQPAAIVVSFPPCTRHISEGCGGYAGHTYRRLTSESERICREERF